MKSSVKLIGIGFEDWSSVGHRDQRGLGVGDQPVVQDWAVLYPYLRCYLDWKP